MFALRDLKAALQRRRALQPVCRKPHEANLPPEELDRLKEQRRNAQNAAWAFADSRMRIDSWARAHDVAQRRGLQRPPDEQ